MSGALRGLSKVGLALVAVLAAVTLVALEGQEVAVLRTRAADGGQRTTRVWVADVKGVPWIEAASPERPFYTDIERDPRVELERAGRTASFVAHPLPGPGGHAEIRALLRARYGWADRWIGAIADTSRSIAVRLEPAPAAGGREPGSGSEAQGGSGRGGAGRGER